MSAFLYFVENHNRPVTRDLIELWGLSYAFDGVPLNSIIRGTNPGKSQHGVLLADQQKLLPYQPSYRPDEQVWRQVPTYPSIWVGRYAAAEFTPDDLSRDEMLDGYEVKLVDDNQWQIPIVRQVMPSGETHAAVPCYLAFDENGRPIRGDVIERHRPLVDRVTPFFDAWYQAWQDSDWSDNAMFSWDKLVPDAVFVLQANYKMSLAEVELLRLFRVETDGSCAQAASILLAACDCQNAIEYLQKKTPADTPPTNVGDAA